MNNIQDRQFIGKLIIAVLTEQMNVREAIKLFPETRDENIECAYHALLHYAADEEMRYQDIEYKDAQDEYLEYIAQILCEGKYIPKNIIDEYKPYYKGIASKWEFGLRGFIKEFKRFINI